MIEESTVRRVSPSPIQKTQHKTFFYPSEREPSCSGKGTFIPRFLKIKPQEEKNFCQNFCAMMCLYCSEKWVNIPDDQAELQRLLPITNPTFQTLQNKITYTWIGHSTAVISIGTKVNLIIDPIFSKRPSPFQWLGPSRYRKPACEIDKLPKIHAVFVSHDHYDHLDENSVNALEELHKPIFFAGLDSQDAFPKGCNLVQMDWAETRKSNINGLQFEITFFPVCHWSKRKLYEKNTRLWGGFVIKTPKGHKIFYCGDTAYCQMFKQIGDMFGPFDLAIIPIGAYLPRRMMQSSHVDPQQAVLIHKDIRSKKSVGVHWGTFPLGFQHYYRPKEDLEIACKAHNLKAEEFMAIGHGQARTIDYL